MRLGATFLLIISGMFIPHDLRGVLFHVFFLILLKIIPGVFGNGEMEVGHLLCVKSPRKATRRRVEK